MPRSNNQLPDLDLLDSPLISPPPFTFLGNVPGSALAEHIFNDPKSWHADDTDLDEPMAWLADEMEKYHASGDQLALSPVDKRDSFSTFLKPFKLDDNIPLFKHDLSLNLDLRLSKIWDSKQHSNKRTSSTPPPLESPLGRALSPMLSPPVASASATWSILELYSVSTPNRTSAPVHTKPTTLPSLRHHSLSMPSPLPTPPPPSSIHTISSSLSSKTATATATLPSTNNSTTLDPTGTTASATTIPTSIRRLPVIPPSQPNNGSINNNNSPPSRSTTPPSPIPPATTSPSSPPTPHRSKSEPLTTTLLHPTRQRGATPPSLKSIPSSPFGTLTRAASASDLLATPNKHKHSASVVVIPNPASTTSPQIVRSPPLGPRPRSGTTPVKTPIKKQHSNLQLGKSSPSGGGWGTPPRPDQTRCRSSSTAAATDPFVLHAATPVRPVMASRPSGTGSIGSSGRRSPPRPMPTVPSFAAV